MAATEAKKDGALFSLPCDPKDYNTGRCRLGVKTMESLGLLVGTPVRIRLPLRDILCTAWPLRGTENEQFVKVDALVTVSTSGEKLPMGLKMNTPVDKRNISE